MQVELREHLNDHLDQDGVENQGSLESKSAINSEETEKLQLMTHECNICNSSQPSEVSVVGAF